MNFLMKKINIKKDNNLEKIIKNIKKDTNSTSITDDRITA